MTLGLLNWIDSFLSPSRLRTVGYQEVDEESNDAFKSKERASVYLPASYRLSAGLSFHVQRRKYADIRLPVITTNLERRSARTDNIGHKRINRSASLLPGSTIPRTITVDRNDMISTRRALGHSLIRSLICSLTSRSFARTAQSLGSRAHGKGDLSL